MSDYRSIIQFVDDETLYNIIHFDLMNYDPLPEEEVIYNTFGEITNKSRNDMFSNVKAENYSYLISSQLQQLEKRDFSLNHTDIDMFKYRICYPNRYLLPNIGIIHSLHDLSTFEQVLNNHFKLYLNPLFNNKIQLFSVECKFTPLMSRVDGLGIISIDSIKTTELINDDHLNDKQSLSITSRNIQCDVHLLYNPIVLIDFSKYKFLQRIDNNNDNYWWYLDNFNYNDFKSYTLDLDSDMFSVKTIYHHIDANDITD